MTTSTIDTPLPLAENLTIGARDLTVKLTDGRAIIVPLEWCPRLLHVTPGERGNWRLIGRGEGMNWPDLDEDISVERLIAGERSGESKKSFHRWLAKHSSRRMHGSKIPSTKSRNPVDQDEGSTLAESS